MYLIIALIGAVLFLINKYFYSYWSSRNVEFLEPKFLVGNLGSMVTLRKSSTDFMREIYEKFKNHRYIGVYFFYRPALVVNDPELIQDIMIRNFTSFTDRPMPADAAENYPLVGHLFNVRGQKWRDLRVKLSPTFTSGKIKAMFPIINDCGVTLHKYIEKNIDNGTDVFEFRDLLARMTTNIISSVAFGIENDCINDRENVFRKMGNKLFEPSFRNAITGLLAFFAPDLFVKSKIDPFGKEVTEFMYSIVKQTVDYREKNKIERNDFLQLLIKLKNEGYVPVDKNDSEEAKSYGHVDEAPRNKITMDEFTANVFLFFVAGFETSSSTASFHLYELCKNPDVQRKAQEEIDRVLKASGGELTYENIGQMKYIDSCIDETLRKYPIVPFLFRIATQDYIIPDSNVKIEKDTNVFIPVIGMQRDPNIYEDPLKFKPERFLDSANGNGRSKGLFYLPFGDGPSMKIFVSLNFESDLIFFVGNCIGARLGKLQSKIGIVHLLRNFNFEYADRSLEKEEIEFHPTAFVLTPKVPILIRASKRKL